MRELRWPFRSSWSVSIAGIAAGGMLACVPARAASQHADLRRAIDAYIESYVATNNFSGQLLAMKGDVVVYNRQLGWAERSRRVPMRAESELHIASMSMQFTAAAIMRLVDQKKLTLDTRVSEIVPSVRGGEAIFVRNLLEMRSGLSDINSRADYAELLRHHQTPASLVAPVSGDTLLFPPGSRYLHEEHSAYNLLALIIEKKSGLSFKRALQVLVFAPAGLTHTGADDDESPPRTLAQGYDPVGVFALDTTTPIHWSAKSGNASIYSTAGDIARWVRQLRHGPLLSAASRAVILDSASTPVGYGWFRRPNKRFGEFAFSMSGRSPGFASYVIYLPREKLTVVALSNIYSSATADIGNDVAAITLGESYTPVALAKALPPELAALDGERFTLPSDFYQPNATLEFAVTKGELFLAWPSGDRTPVIPVDADHAIDRAYWEPIAIERDSTGRATYLTYDRFRGTRTAVAAAGGSSRRP